MYSDEYYEFLRGYYPDGEPSDVLTVVDGTVFTVVKQVNSFILLPVGTIPIGTGCFLDQFINGHYAVPRSLVQWSGTVEPLVVVAKCA
jgi:hypothetical protein